MATSGGERDLVRVGNDVAEVDLGSVPRFEVDERAAEGVAGPGASVWSVVRA
ncbi:MAG: hypothetical protein R2736_21045 [Solirubrobacterales bacterium]